MTDQELRRVTIEEYIRANGGISDFLEGLAEFAKDHGLDWKDHLTRMHTEAEWKARAFKGLV